MWSSEEPTCCVPHQACWVPGAVSAGEPVESRLPGGSGIYTGSELAVLSNITASERLMNDLQDQTKAAENHRKRQQDVLQPQKNQTNLEREFSYHLNHCIQQMRVVKEQCEGPTELTKTK